MTSNKSSPRFLPTLYSVSPGPGDGWATLKITGQKFGAPNHRLTLNQKGFKVKGARIIYSQKNKQIEHQVGRINYLPSFEEVRLHVNSPLYPGNYEITFEFSPFDLEKLKQLSTNDLSDVDLRELLPSFDNEEARANIKIEFS